MSTFPFVHVEIAAKDPHAAGEFYGKLFGWKIEVDPNFDYVQFDSGTPPGGGFPKVDGQMTKDGDVILYVGTDDIEGMLAKVTALGGKTLVPKTEIPGIGYFAIFEGAGTRMALYTPIGKM